MANASPFIAQEDYGMVVLSIYIAAKDLLNKRGSKNKRSSEINGSNNASKPEKGSTRISMSERHAEFGKKGQ